MLIGNTCDGRVAGESEKMAAFAIVYRAAISTGRVQLDLPTAAKPEERALLLPMDLVVAQLALCFRLPKSQ